MRRVDIDRYQRHVDAADFRTGLLNRHRGLRIGHGDCVVSGIELDEHGSGLHVLVVIDGHAGDIAGDASRDRINVSVDLRVIGRLQSSIVTIDEDSGCHGREQQDRCPDPNHRGTPLFLHGYLTPRYVSADCSATPTAWANEILAEL